MRTELPSGWESAELGCLAQLINGDRGDSYPTKSSFVSDGVPFINAGHLNDGEITSTEMNYITLSAFQALRSGQVREDDILFCLRGSLGKVGLVKGIEKGAIASSLVIVRPIAQAHPRFLLYFLRSPLANKEIDKHNNGSAQPNLASKSLAKFVVPVAPIEEQKRIAEKLDTVLTRVDAVNTRLARVAPLLKRFRQSVLAAATSGRLTEDWRGGRAVNETWRVIPLGKYVENHDGARVPISETLRTERRGAYPYYGASGVIDTIDGFTHEGKFVLIGEDGANLVTRSKPIAFIATGKIWVNNHAHVLKCKEGASDEYLAYYINSIDLTPYVSGSAQPKLNQKNLNTIPVPVPPTEEQTEIVRRVETLFAFADRLEARLAQAQTAATRLTPALLAKAFRGELVPQDPNDEPAAELLRRLQAQRATAVSASKTGTGRGRGRTAVAAPAVTEN